MCTSSLLVLLLLRREEEYELSASHRVETVKTMRLEGAAEKFSEIQASRVKTMRQLLEARKYLEKPRKVRTGRGGAEKQGGSRGVPLHTQPEPETAPSLMASPLTCTPCLPASPLSCTS